MLSKNFATLFVFFAVAAAACSAPTPESNLVRNDAGKEDAGGDNVPPAALRFRPAAIYSGFDGVHTYKAPVAIYDASDDLQLTISDSGATIAPVKLSATDTLDSGRYFMLTTTKAGDFTLTATSKGSSVTAKVKVTAYTTERWTRGEQRYGGGDPPCTQCHSTDGIDHSPAALAGISDAAVGLVVTEGIAPNGFPISVNHPSNHKWAVSEEERDGLVTFLRTLEPRGFAP